MRNKRTGKILKPQLNKKGGYYRVGLGGGKREYVHRLVAKTFYDDFDESKRYDINHMDGNKLNNSIANLEWYTRKENIQHAFDNGLKSASRVSIVCCDYCKHRYDYDICDGKSDDFYCAYGEA